MLPSFSHADRGGLRSLNVLEGDGMFIDLDSTEEKELLPENDS